MLGIPGRCPVSFGRGAGCSFLRSGLSGGRLDPLIGGRGAGLVVPAIGGRGLVVSNGGEGAELGPSPPVPSVSSNGEADFFGMGFPLRGPFPLSSGMDVSCWLMGASRRGIMAPGRGCWPAPPAEVPGSLPRARPACAARPAPRRGRRTERVSTRDGASPDTAGRDGSPCVVGEY